MRTVLSLLGLLLLGVLVHTQHLTSNIVIDSFDNPTDLGEYFVDNVTCGANGDWCNTPQLELLQKSITQTGPWAEGQAPLGGERYTFLSIDQIQPGYEAGPADNVQISYDLVSKLRFATSPGIGGTLVMLWNGPGNNVLPCESTLANPCRLDAACCTGANPAGDFSGTSPYANADGSIDLTANGTQLGITLVQNTADHDAPLILRIFGADGRSVVLTKSFEFEYVRRTILFLYRDFKPFVGDSPQLTQSDVISVLKNAKAVAFSIYGAIALDARMTSIRTVGVQVTKELDDEYVDKLFRPGDRVCWTAVVANNAPSSLNPPGSDQTNVFVLQDVEFDDYMFWNSELNLDRTTIQVSTSRPGLEYSTHENDPANDYLKVSMPYLHPADNVTIKFCGVVRNDFDSDLCRSTFCNEASLNVPIFEIEELATKSTCIEIKWEPKIAVTAQCPTSKTGTDTPSVIIGYSNSGNGPADDSELTIRISGVSNPGLLDGLSQNQDWSCEEDEDNNRLECKMYLGKIRAGSYGTKQFALNLAALGCEESGVRIDAILTEKCSNLTATTHCSLPVPRKVEFDINKHDSSGGAGIQPKGTITYTINFQNTGNFRADGVQLFEYYDAEYTTPKDDANQGWDCDDVAKVCTYNVGTLQPGEMKSVQFTVTLAEELPISLNQVCNRVTISNRNSSDIEACIFEKTAQKCSSILPGIPETGIEKHGYVGLLVYRVTYFNNGTADAQNTILRETIPAGTNFVANESDPRWNCIGDTCTINLGVLPKGARASAIFAVEPIQDFVTGVTECWLNRATIQHTASVSDQSPLDNVAALDLGNCGNCTTGPMKCPLPCQKCPDCVLNLPDCHCREQECNCPKRECNCPPNDCRCPPKTCNCPAVQGCSPCPDCKCDCPDVCPTIEECEEEELECVAPAPGHHDGKGKDKYSREVRIN